MSGISLTSETCKAVIADRNPVLRIRGLRIVRRDPVSRTEFALEVPEFEVLQLDRIGFVGPSGSGKTTFLEMLGLLIWPDEIESFILSPEGDGRMIDILPPMLRRNSDALAEIRAKGIGFIMQDGGLLPYLTVFENARLAAELAMGKHREHPQKIKNSAHAIGIGDLLHRMPATLSGGQRQRAAVLRAVAANPKLLIGDEPTASLDLSASEDVMELLTSQAETRRAAVVLASHNANLLRRFGFRIARVSIEESPTLRRATLSVEESE